MIGVRAAAYRTQQFDGGVYAAYRTDYRDVVLGADGLWDHVCDPTCRSAFNVESAFDHALVGRRRCLARRACSAAISSCEGDSLYLPPAHYIGGVRRVSAEFPAIPENAGAGRRALRPDEYGRPALPDRII